MSLQISQQEFDAVRRLPANKRLEYLVKRVVDQRSIWSLRNDAGWVVGSDESGREVFPVWPHSKYAEASATGAWAGTKPGRIGLRDWLSTWTEGLTSDSRLVAVFPTDRGDEAAMSPIDLADAIRAEQHRFG